MGSAANKIMAVVLTTVTLSVFLHGLTAAPFARLYGRFCATSDRRGLAEAERVPSLPTRFDATPD